MPRAYQCKAALVGSARGAAWLCSCSSCCHRESLAVTGAMKLTASHVAGMTLTRDAKSRLRRSSPFFEAAREEYTALSR